MYLISIVAVLIGDLVLIVRMNLFAWKGWSSLESSTRALEGKLQVKYSVFNL